MFTWIYLRLTRRAFAARCAAYLNKVLATR